MKGSPAALKSPEIPAASTCAADELERLYWDCVQSTKGRLTRWFTVPFSLSFAIIAFYRLNRAAYLTFGKKWQAFRILTSPLNPLIRIFIPSQIDYRADIGPGMRILHPELGVVVNQGFRAGRGLILAGGNCIGDGSPAVGNWVHVGANATIMGDVTLGSSVRIGAGAVVVKDFDGPGVLVGVPARPVDRRTGAASGTTLIDEADLAV
ncbi:MAG TPA: hypothetical protein VNS19_22045 [Acidimicrobiales bacterium]|nr:hypothetical protein [Acidimicrobiales bacterium]